MNKLSIIEHQNQRVLTTQQIAEAYGTDTVRIRNNYAANKARYQEGKHYYKAEGATLDALKEQVRNSYSQNLNKVRSLMLWTEKGALLHAKSLNTDQAWEVYDQLVETYFKAREMFTAPRNYVEALEAALTLAKQIEEQKPAVIFHRTCLKSGDSILVRELAKLASSETNKMGEKKLFKTLRGWGHLNAKNEPYQQYIDCGYYEVIERPYYVYGEPHLAFTTKVLPKGQAYILNRLAV